MDSASRVARRFKAKTAKIHPSEITRWGFDDLMAGKSVTLYHGTTSTFKAFDMSKSRTELVNNYYGAGIFFTPSKRVAWQYAEASRNTGFDSGVIDEVRQKSRGAGDFLEALYKHGNDGWEIYMKEAGFVKEDESWDIEGFDAHLGGIDPQRLGDIAGYIIGSKMETVGSSDALDLFGGGSTGTPEQIFDNLDTIGIDSAKYRPKVYTVTVTVGKDKTLLTANKSQARRAKSKGYEAVIFHGSDLVGGVPEVAVFQGSRVRVSKVDVGD
jgi:ADP-Ribosyltransferase in polyvalent proteins